MADKLNIQFRIKAIDNFSRVMDKLDRKLDGMKNKIQNIRHTINVDVDVDEDGFNRQMDHVRDRVQRVNDRIIIDTDVNGDTDLIRRLRNIQGSTDDITDRIDVDVDVDVDRELNRLPGRLKRIGDQTQHLNQRLRVKVDVDSDGNRILRRINNDINRINRRTERIKIRVVVQDFLADFRTRVSRIASYSRNIGELLSHYLIGGIVSALPMLSPVVASAAAALGSLLPIIGTLGGGILGLGTSFGLAGAGALGYGILATSVLGDVFKASEKLGELQEELNNASDEKERTKILEKMKDAMGALNSEQQRALLSLGQMKSTWAGIRKAMEPQIVTTFGTAMQVLSSILEKTTPMFESVVKHADNLVNALKLNIESDDFMRFIDVLNTQAGPAMETITKALGNFTMGILNIMTAFAPMSVDMSKGFLGMSESFREWTASLADSKRFNAFVDYAKENLPKLADIFGSLIKGLSSMGEAFAPFAADMLTGLQNLMNRFQEFSAGMKTNDGFQKFIAYARENGPTVISFIGELIKFIVNLGVAFAPVGETLLKFNDGMFEVINGMMEALPWVTQVIAAILSLGAMFLTHLPTIMLFRTAMTHLGPVFMAIMGRITALLPLLGNIGARILSVLPTILNMGRTIGMLASGPIGILIGVVGVLAYTIYKNWDSIKAWTSSMISKMKTYFSQLSADAKAKFAEISRWASDMKTKVVNFFGQLSSGVKAKFAEVKKWASDMVSRVIGFFSTLSSSVSSKFSSLKSTISSTIGSINLYESGKKIVKGLIDGITSMIGAAGKAIGSVAQKVRNFLPFSPAKEGPLRDINKLNFAGPITDSIYGDAKAIQNAMGSVLSIPEITAQGLDASSYSARSNGFAPSNKGVNDGISELLKVMTSDENKGDVVLVVDGSELARVQRKHNDQLQGSRMSLLTAVRGV